MAIRRFTDRGGFISIFNDENGDYMRTGILDANGIDTGEEPFCSEFPQLLDIGIMGHCIHGLNGLCSSCGVECYQSGAYENQPNMIFEYFKNIISQCEGRTFQVALGGRGDPEMHENFEDILACCRHFGIVPNITTSGYGLTRSLSSAIAKYCGAAAVSWYKTSYTYRAIDMLLEKGVTTNIHFVLGKNSISEAVELLEQNKIPQGVSRIIFLLHKPVGQGSRERVLSIEDPLTRFFFQLISKPEIVEKIGFDSCLVPGIAAHCPQIPHESYDACEAGRFSAYIGPDLKMTPCSFDKSDKFAESLYEKSISDIWNGDKFSDYREAFKKRCQGCEFVSRCLGGCPIESEINLCGKYNQKYK